MREAAKPPRPTSRLARPTNTPAAIVVRRVTIAPSPPGPARRKAARRARGGGEKAGMGDGNPMVRNLRIRYHEVGTAARVARTGAVVHLDGRASSTG